MPDKPFSADQMRKLARSATVDADSPVIRCAIDTIQERIRQKAKQGKFELVYPFDGIDAETGAPLKLSTGWCNRLTAEQIQVIVDAFRKLGFKYEYRATQDPGHPADREFHAFTWS